MNGVLYQTSHDEGRIVKGIYEYNITDHNNDLRVAFRDSLGIAVPTQSIFYDPFGNELRGLSFERNPATKNNFKFLGRESLPELGLVDLQKRWYDPVIGRFISVDPSPDIGGQESLSPYQYSWNNPVLLSDPDGDYPDGGGDDTQSEFFLARLVTTAFYDVKHAIFNTGARAVGSNYRASYATNSDGQKVFETKYAKAATPTTLKEVGKEVASGLLDVISGVKAGPAGIGVLAESSETQTARGVKGVIQSTTKGAEKGSLSATKDAVKDAKSSIGLNSTESLPKGQQGKFGSPQRGDSKKGYRLDPAHPNAKPGSGEEYPHVNFWDYTKGKRNNGGIEGAVPIKY